MTRAVCRKEPGCAIKTPLLTKGGLGPQPQQPHSQHAHRGTAPPLCPHSKARLKSEPLPRDSTLEAGLKSECSSSYSFENSVPVGVFYRCYCCWGGSSNSGCHLCTLLGGKGLGWQSCSHGRPRYKTNGCPKSWPQPFCATRFALETLWAQCPRGTWANCLNSHSWGGVRAMSKSLHFVSPHNRWQVTPECTSWWTAPVEEYSVAPLPVDDSSPTYLTL